MERIEFAKNVLKFAKEAGFKLKSKKKIGNEDFEKAARTPNGDYWHSSVTKNQDEKEYNKKSFLAFILDEDEESDDSRYNDFSLVFFPQILNGEVTKCLICLGVGTNGFSKDSEIASLPYPRRFFLKMQKCGAKLHFKQNFENIEYTIPELNDRLDDYGQIEKYGNYLQICEFEEDFKNEENFAKIKGIRLPKSIMRWIIYYAHFREWINKEEDLDWIQNRMKKEESLQNWMKKIYGKKTTLKEENNDDEIKSIYEILKTDKYVILQGAPGVGKTYTTSKLSQLFKQTVFEQFHAETTYSDFIYGIVPDTEAEELKYKKKEGVLYKAIDEALKALGKEWDYLKKPIEDDCFSEDTAVLLIIDEINRANLSNVLGPVFYLFERSSQNRTNLIQIGNKEICRLPENLCVVGTMNTADRSLAVVDFALRRRFTWITLTPKNLSGVVLDPPYDYFNEREFEWFKETFEKYATDAELNLQPGQEYFLTKKPQDNCPQQEHPMYYMMKFKLMPLIKEYLNEGFLQRAKDAFSIYFFNEWNLNLYE